MSSDLAIVKLLQKLFKRTARQNTVSGQYQRDFLKKIQANHSESETNLLVEQCIKQLENDEGKLEDVLHKGQDVASQSLNQLTTSNYLSEKTQQNLEQIKSSTPPFSIIDFHNELTNVIKIYQHVVSELNENISSANSEQLPQCDDANAELQELILNIDISEAYAKKLEVISHKLAVLDDPCKLPEYCIAIITIIVESTRDERRSSRHFLYTINDSLTQFYLNFAKNVKNTEKSFESQEACLKTIQRNSVRLKSNAEQAIDLESLRNNIFAYVENVEQLIAIKEKEKGHRVQLELQSMVREIKELQNETKGYQQTLKQQSEQLHIDFLTKIPNRAAWSLRLESEFQRSKRYKNPLNIAIIDIDNFKKINDTFGHLAGDKVLNAIAQKLQQSLRTVDFLARYGGEEFAVLLPEVTKEQMQIALEKLRHKVKNIPFKFKKDKISITISIGCTNLVSEDEIDDAFERADSALYHAKNNGRDQVIYFAKE